jgi:uncharacterized RmlC-like cupin family protein
MLFTECKGREDEMARANVKVRRNETAAKKRAAQSGQRTKARVKTPPRPRSKSRRKHAFIVNHVGEEAFKIDGLRRYARYRDLGVKDATHGMVVAHVIRFIPPCDPKEVSKEHYHDTEFQMIYVLKGWITSSFEDQGTHTMKAGDAWLQPPRIKHKVLDYSDDCEVLEIVMPANFKTVELGS